MAVRLAPGAGPGSLVALIMRDAVIMVLMAAWWVASRLRLAARSLQGVLFGVGAGDEIAFAGAAAC